MTSCLAEQCRRKHKNGLEPLGCLGLAQSFFFFWSYFKSVSQIINAVDIQDATDYLIRKGGVENMAYLRIVIPAAFKPSHISFEITLPNRKNLAWPYESYMNY